MKQQSTFFKLMHYMGKKKPLLPLSLGLSALSSLAGMMPFICIWFIIRLFFKQESSELINNINYYAWMVFGFSILSIIAYFLSLICSHLAAFRVEKGIRYQSMNKVIDMSLGFFNQTTVGKMRKIIDDNAGITHTFTAHQLPDLIGGIMVLLSTFVFMFTFDWRMGFICLLPLFIAIKMFRTMMGDNYAESMTKYMNSLENMNTEAVEYVRGIPVVKVFQQTVYSFKRFHTSIINYKEWVTNYSKKCRRSMLTYTVAINSFTFLLIPFAIILIIYGSDWKQIVLNLIFYVIITPFLGQSFMKLMYMIDGYRQAGEAISRIENLFSNTSIQKGEDKEIKKHEIIFNEVSFYYENSNKPAIKNINLHIPEGKIIALVGASGSGKTTLARLIARFWDVRSGEITIGGVNIKEIEPKELMKHISFVFQNTHLFKTSLRENILYGKPDATDKEIKRALTLAQGNEIIEKLPDGLETKIGSEGIFLSGGEQQRIALARAFLKDAPILLLDEATAFADPENEHEIKKALFSLMKGKTVVMIAHRLTSIQNVERIIVMDKGEIVEQGSHKELLENKGIYTSMWEEYQKSVKWSLIKEKCYA